MTCVALYCHNRSSRKIEGTTFHRFPRDPKRREAWTEALNRKNWCPSDASVVCSLHFEDSMFYRLPTMLRVFLNPDAVPTIFPKDPAKSKMYARSKKQPQDPLKDSPQKGMDIDRVRRKRGRPPKHAKIVDPIAVEKITRTPQNVALVSKELENGPGGEPNSSTWPNICKIQNSNKECTSQDIAKTASQTTTGKGSAFVNTRESRKAAREFVKAAYEAETGTKWFVGASRDSRKTAFQNAMGNGSAVVENQDSRKESTRDIVETAFRDAMGEDNFNGSTIKENLDSSEETTQDVAAFRNGDSDRLQNNNCIVSKNDSRTQKDAVTIGAGDNLLLVNLVCPHCEKACRVCVGVKPRPDTKPKKGQFSCDWKTSVQLRVTKQQLQHQKQLKKFLRKKIKLLQQDVRRLTQRNARLQKTMVSMIEDNDDELEVIGSVNGVLKDA